MRRARIKAVATVPIRRKATQDGPVVENVEQTEKNLSEKTLEEKVEEKTRYTQTEINKTEPEQLIIHEAEKKLTIPTLNDKDCIEIKIHDNECKSKNDGQKISKLEFQQTIPTACIEGT
jgi:hypothetical protein